MIFIIIVFITLFLVIVKLLSVRLANDAHPSVFLTSIIILFDCHFGCFLPYFDTMCSIIPEFKPISIDLRCQHLYRKSSLSISHFDWL